MIRQLLLLIFVLSFSIQLTAQNADLIAVNGFYIIQEKIPFKKGDSVFCNPATMPDRIILDSAKKMIVKKTSNPLGYTYYEWRNKNNNLKTYEEIQIPYLKLKHATYYTDSGIVNPPDKNTFTPFCADYFRGPTNIKQKYNGLWIAERIRVSLSKQAVDSLLILYKSLKGKLLIGTKFWTELNFYENGKLQSTGILITGLKESTQNTKEKELIDQMHAPENQFRIGVWRYYETSGELNNQETITILRKVTSNSHACF